MQRSRAFLGILLALLAVRLLLHDYIGHLISPLQTAAVFYLLAFGMIVRWRWTMYRQYQALVDSNS
jgi:membrane protein CcdC involved in cytochrome C biogenesis